MYVTLVPDRLRTGRASLTRAPVTTLSRPSPTLLRPGLSAPSRASVLVLGLAVVLGACRDGGSSEPAVCRIDYELLNGEPGQRYDLLYPSLDGRTLTRVVYDNGGNTETRWQYYAFDDSGRLAVEAMDSDLDGELDARLDGQERLIDLVTPLTVDARIEDGNLDGVQFSLDLPSSRIGSWEPARIYFQTSCDLGDFNPIPEGPKQLRVELDQDGDDTFDGTLAFQWTEDDRLQVMTADLNDDGVTDHAAILTYNERGQISEVRWRKDGEYFGQEYVRGSYTYDAFGNLYSYEVDIDADGEAEHRITYSLDCYPDNRGGL